MRGRHALADQQFAALQAGDAALGHVDVDQLAERPRVGALDLLGRALVAELTLQEAARGRDARLPCDPLGDDRAEAGEAVRGEDVVGTDALVDDVAHGGLDRGRQDAHGRDQPDADHEGRGGGRRAPRVAHGVQAGQTAGEAEEAGQRRAEATGQGLGHDGAQHRDAHEGEHRSQADEREPVAHAAEQPVEEGRVADHGDDAAGRKPPSQRPVRLQLDVAHGRHRRNPARLAGRHQRARARHQHAGQQADDRGAREELERGMRQVSTQRLEQRGEARGHADAQGHARHRGDEADDERLE